METENKLTRIAENLYNDFKIGHDVKIGIGDYRIGHDVKIGNGDAKIGIGDLKIWNNKQPKNTK